MLQLSAIGNVGKDPELRTINGKTYTATSIGVWLGKDKTQWIGVMIYGDQLANISKGGKLYVCGMPSYKVYNNTVSTDVWVDKWEYLTKREKAEPSDANEDI